MTMPDTLKPDELVERQSSETVKAMLDVHAHLSKHTQEPFWVSHQDSYRLKGEILHAAVDVDKMERRLSALQADLERVTKQRDDALAKLKEILDDAH